MRILVVGAGATGGYFGGLLAEAGRDVTFLVRPERAERLAADGLRIVTPDGNHTVAPVLLTPDHLASTYDVILLSVKAYSLDQAIEDAARAVGPDTMILPVLNGLRHLDTLVARFGERPVLGGLCFVFTQLDGDGRIVQLRPGQELVYGDRHEPDSARIRALDATMRDAGFVTRASTEIVRDMWRKWVFLASLGAVTGLMRGTVGQVEAAPGGRQFAEAVLAECAAVADASGEPIGEEALARARATITQPGSSTTSSLFRDLQQGRTVEADHIIGDLVARAARLGVPAPLLGLARTNLSVHQAATPA